ncbi:MAG TPA: hypothetical protein DDY13_19365, partial [Cytophagales bacterium]|nr:hypothetical protein [Cytophagales bacterium]
MIQFKNPELLWALVLLAIPIIIHLFHLRRFKKTPFTNVALLKTIKLTTRKSSRLKKWLILFARLGMLTMIILAFAQPFLPNSKNFNKSSELVIYLDNSFSMQAKGSNGSLLNVAKQQLINYLPEKERFTLFTNEQSFTNVTKETIIKHLIDLDFSHTQLPFEAAYLKGLEYFNANEKSIKNLLFISDFQQYALQNFKPEDSSVSLGCILLRPQKNSNISIDSVYFGSGEGSKELNVTLSNFGQPIENVAVSLFENDQLITKAATALDNESTVQFTLDKETTFSGKVEISDDGLNYDNRLYFNVEQPERINVLSINGTDDLFLRKIFTDDEFKYSGYDVNSLEYNKLFEQNILILNHLDLLPQVLVETISDFYLQGGTVLIMPDNEADVSSYNALLSVLNQPLFTERLEEIKKVTTIVFDHPLLSDAFYSRVSNFQYPEVKSYFKSINSKGSIYSLEDGNALLSGGKRVFLFNADITEENSNFLQSPLIVPALYNMARQSLRPKDLYYTIGQKNTIVLRENMSSEDIVHL